jgi:hypothetical protein
MRLSLDACLLIHAIDGAEGWTIRLVPAAEWDLPTHAAAEYLCPHGMQLGTGDGG